MTRLLLSIAMLLGATLVNAQGYPNRAIRLVVPWPPGQATDLGGRLIAQKMSEYLGQPIVIDNRPGSGGTIGTDLGA